MDRIINGTEWGGSYTPEFIENYSDLVQDWEFTEIECNPNFIVKKWNGSQWIEGATAEQIAEYNRNIVPSKISRMKFIIQINRSTGIKYEDIAIFINNIPNEYLSENEKYEIISRLKAAVDFERYNTDLLTIAQMMGITSEQLDEIFINGNLLN